MKPGRELDALVAGRVMGWRPPRFDDFGDIGRSIVESEGRDLFEPPRYSTDISAAWEVVEKLRSDNLNCTIGNGKNGNSYQAEFRERSDRALYTGKWWFSINSLVASAKRDATREFKLLNTYRASLETLSRIAADENQPEAVVSVGGCVFGFEY